jgi:Tfp pilus assembly protein PilO
MTDHQEERSPFPAWLKDLCYFGGIIVTLVVFGLTQRSDLRSTREELSRLTDDVRAVRQSLPNKEVYDMKLSELTQQNAQLRNDFEIEKLRTQNLREHLIKKGWVE